MTGSIYTPLPKRHIRLLRLQKKTYADPEDSPCVCELITTNIDGPDRKGYTTLSYTWDDPRPKQDHNDDTYTSYQKDLFPVECNGVEVLVRKNLYDALRRYRYFSDVEWIWVDGICINQNDTDERNAQVELMGEIYSQCKGLLIWLGDSDQHSTRAMPLIRKLGEAAGSNWDDEKNESQWILDSPFGDSKVFEYFGISPFTDDDWLSIAHFLGRSWFNRVWTIQEYCLPPLVAFVCGLQFQPSVDVREFCHFLLQVEWNQPLMSLAHLENGLPLCTSMSNAKRLWPGSRTRPALDRWLKRLYGENNDDPAHKTAAYAGFAVECSRYRLASDPRDKVVAPLALASRFGTPKVRLVPSPDYAKSVVQTYVEFVRYVVTGTRSLAVLSQTIPQFSWQERESSLPSWVPDFRHGSTDVYTSFAMNEKFCASLESIASYIDFPDDLSIKVRGYLLTKVTATSHLWVGEAGFDFLKLLRLAKATSLQRNGSSWFESFVHAITASAVVELPKITLRDSLEQQFAFMIFANPDIQRLGGIFWENDDINSIMAKAHQHAFEITTMCSGSDISPRREHLDAALRQIQHLSMTLIGCSNSEILRNSSRHEFIMQGKSFRNAMGNAIGGRHFLATEIGAIGLGPEQAMTGDEVWILPGARVPILLRPTSRESKVVVGEVYLHGMMNGEPFAGVLSFTDPVIMLLE